MHFPDELVEDTARAIYYAQLDTPDLMPSWVELSHEQRDVLLYAAREALRVSAVAVGSLVIEGYARMVDRYVDPEQYIPWEDVATDIRDWKEASIFSGIPALIEEALLWPHSGGRMPRRQGCELLASGSTGPVRGQDGLWVSDTTSSHARPSGSGLGSREPWSSPIRTAESRSATTTETR